MNDRTQRRVNQGCGHLPLGSTAHDDFVANAGGMGPLGAAPLWDKTARDPTV